MLPPDNEPTVYVVDDDLRARMALKPLFESAGLRCEIYASPVEFVASERSEKVSCLILDVRSPELSEIDLVRDQQDCPILITSAHADIRMAVKAIRGGALDFFCKPYRDHELLDAVHSALMRSHASRQARMQLLELLERYASLTLREKQIMQLVCDGLRGKQVAHRLGIAEITVKFHRQNTMRKLGARSFPALVRMADAIGANASTLPGADHG